MMYLPIDLSVEQRNAECPFHSLFIYDRLNDILIDFLDNEWHGNNPVSYTHLECGRKCFDRQETGFPLAGSAGWKIAGSR